MRVGHLENSILSVLLKNGAKTTYQLAAQIENIDLSQAHSRSKAFFRTMKQLKQKQLITTKPYFQYVPKGQMCLYMVETGFWAEGCYWKRYCGSGFHRRNTRGHNYGYFHIYGLTSEGKKQIQKRIVNVAKSHGDNIVRLPTSHYSEIAKLPEEKELIGVLHE